MPAHHYQSYEEFGRRFFDLAVTEERVGAAIASIAGQDFSMGPMAQGPGGLAKVTARVSVQPPVVRRRVDEHITFTIRIPLTIDLTIDLRLDKPRFTIDGSITLHATVRAATPMLIVIDLPQPGPADIVVNVESRTVRGELLRVVAGVDGEIRRFIAAHVAAEIDSPQAQEARIIDVAQQIDVAWPGG